MRLPGSFPPWWGQQHRSTRWRGRPCWGRSSDASRSRGRNAADRSASLTDVERKKVRMTCFLLSARVKSLNRRNKNPDRSLSILTSSLFYPSKLLPFQTRHHNPEETLWHPLREALTAATVRYAVWTLLPCALPPRQAVFIFIDWCVFEFRYKNVSVYVWRDLRSPAASNVCFHSVESEA